MRHLNQTLNRVIIFRGTGLTGLSQNHPTNMSASAVSCFFKKYKRNGPKTVPLQSDNTPGSSLYFAAVSACKTACQLKKPRGIPNVSTPGSEKVASAVIIG